MSLWLHERLQVGLSPREVVLARRAPGWRPAAADVRTLPCPRTEQPPSWQAPLRALEAAFDEGKVHGASVGVVLSNHFVRYAVLPWSEDFTRPAEREALARHHFARVHGEQACAAWRIRLSEGRYGAGALACAVDEALLERLQALCAASRLRLQSVRPYFMSAFNRIRRKVGNSGCFCLAEPGRLCVGLFRSNAWEAVQSQRLASDAGGGEFERLLTRMLRAVGAPPDMPVFVCGAESLLCNSGSDPEADRARWSAAGLPALHLFKRSSRDCMAEPIAPCGAA